MKLSHIVHKGSWDAVHKQLLDQARAVGMSLILADNQAKRQSLTYHRLRRYAGQRPDGHLIKPIKLPVARADVDLRLIHWKLRRAFHYQPIPMEVVLGEQVARF